MHTRLPFLPSGSSDSPTPPSAEGASLDGLVLGGWGVFLGEILTFFKPVRTIFFIVLDFFTPTNRGLYLVGGGWWVGGWVVGVYFGQILTFFKVVWKLF